MKQLARVVSVLLRLGIIAALLVGIYQGSRVALVIVLAWIAIAGEVSAARVRRIEASFDAGRLGWRR